MKPTNTEIAIDAIFSALDVGLDGAEDALGIDVGTLEQGDGFSVRTVEIDGAVYQIHVTRL